MKLNKNMHPTMKTAFKDNNSVDNHPSILKPADNDVIKKVKYTKQDPLSKESKSWNNNSASNDTKSSLSNETIPRQSGLDSKEFENFLKENPTNERCKQFITEYHKSGGKNSFIPTKVLQQTQCDQIKKKFDERQKTKEFSLEAGHLKFNQNIPIQNKENSETTNDLRSYSIFAPKTPKASNNILSGHLQSVDIKGSKLEKKLKASSKSDPPANLKPVNIRFASKTKKRTPKKKNNNENEVFKPRLKKQKNINSSIFSGLNPPDPQIAAKTILSEKKFGKPTPELRRLQEEVEQAPYLKSSFVPYHSNIRGQMGSIRYPRHILSEPLRIEQNNVTATSLAPIISVFGVLIVFIVSIFLVKFYKKRGSFLKKSTLINSNGGKEIELENIN